MKLQRITRTTVSMLSLLLTFAVAAPAMAADWGGLMDMFKKQTSQESTEDAENGLPAGLSPASLSQDEMVNGLRQALDKGAEYAVEKLGSEGGYLNDARVRIPMPSGMAWVEKSLRTLGQEKMADDFVLAMNRAAERAAPEALGIFRDAISGMSLQDARDILSGPEDAATQYFRSTSGEALAQRLAPIVKESTDAAGVTSSYKQLMGKVGVMGSFMGGETVDIDSYVTDKAVDGLFVMMAEEEKRIRENPLERSTDLLRKVFGAYSR